MIAPLRDVEVQSCLACAVSDFFHLICARPASLPRLISGWKRLLLADGPRQSINALVLYSFAYSFGFQTNDIPAYWDKEIITAMLLWSMILTVLIFAGSMIMLIAAAVCYVPLLCYIQGNLKVGISHGPMFQAWS